MTGGCETGPRGQPGRQTDDVEQKLLRVVCADPLMEHVRQIAKYVRLSGDEGEAKAFAYIKEVLESAGLPVQLYSHDAYISLPRSARLQVAVSGLSGTGAATDIPCITAAFGASTPPGGLEAKVVDVRDGSPGSYPDNAAGKIVLVDGLASPDAAVIAARHGAAGLIAASSDEHLHWMIVSPVWGSPTPDEMRLLPDLPVVVVNRSAGERLRAYMRAAQGGQGAQGAQGAQGVVRVETRVETGWRKIPQLVVDIPGPEGTFIMLSGHVDSWTHGAMDNAAANAVMLEVARLSATERPAMRRGLRVCFWSGHSHGRYAGSSWYADHHWQDLYDNCLCHINVDSPGAVGAEILTEAVCMPETHGLAADAVREQARQEFRGNRIGRMGDHSFMNMGVSSIFVGLSEQSPSGGFQDHIPGTAQEAAGRRSGGVGWWWHTDQDTVDKIDPRNLARDARVYLSVVWCLLTRPVAPLDYARTAVEIADRLERWNAEVRGQLPLDGCLAKASSLARALQRLTATVDAVQVDPGTRDVARLNRCLIRLARALVPLNYARRDIYAQDAAMSQPPLPSLAGLRSLVALPPESDEAKSLLVDLARRRNRVAHLLDQALDAAGEALVIMNEAGPAVAVS